MKLVLICDGLAERVPGRQLVDVYHGTSTAVLPSIAQHGLLCGAEACKLTDDDIACSDLSVTTDIDYTEQWCEEAVWKFGGEPIILKAKVPRGRLLVNREMMAHTTPPSAVSSAFVRGGKIEPQQLFVLYNNQEIPLLDFVRANSHISK
jgi:hypothetical protein